MLFLVALTLGAWASELSQTEALSGWLATHPPSEKMWRHALLSRGLKEIDNPSTAQKAAKALPSLVEAEGNVWVSEDSNWLALFHPSNSGRPIAFFCLNCLNLPKSWASSGNGWEAFDPVLDRIDRAAALAKTTVTAKKVLIPRDPREIVY